jgi:hypothetical protein
MPTKSTVKKKRLVKKKVVSRAKPSAPAKKAPAKKVINKKPINAPVALRVRMHRIAYDKYLQRPNLSNTVKNALLLGATTAQCLSMVAKWFPKSTLNASNVSQYRRLLRAEGLNPIEKETTIRVIIGKKPS